MIVLHDARAVVLLVPRTASLSLATLLRGHCDGRAPDRDPHDMHVPEEWLGYRSYAVHRNPYTHLASLYRRGLAKPDSGFAPVSHALTFPAFVRWAVLADGPPAVVRGWRPVRQTDYLYAFGWPRVDQWLPYEHLAESLRALPFVGDAADQLPRLNMGCGDAAYDETSAGLVYGWARGEFERHGYAASDWR